MEKNPVNFFTKLFCTHPAKHLVEHGIRETQIDKTKVFIHTKLLRCCKCGRELDGKRNFLVKTTGEDDEI